jgi:hypothetical protein
MTSPTSVWICAAFHPTYLCGGWAYVQDAQGQVTGAAGGERRTTASRMALTGLAAALRGLPPCKSATATAPVDIRTTSPDLALFAEILAGLGEQTPAAPPETDLDIWARVISASTGRRLALTLMDPGPNTPLAFAAAWAELARDKAKATGPFTASIPKTNLAKVAGLGSP